MAINLQNKVTLVISTCLILTTSLIIGHWFVSRNSKDVGAGIEKSSFPEVCFYGFAISAEILGVIGTIKQEKWLLVPIIFLFSCVITACIGCYLNQTWWRKNLFMYDTLKRVWNWLFYVAQYSFLTVWHLKPNEVVFVN